MLARYKNFHHAGFIDMFDTITGKEMNGSFRVISRKKNEQSRSAKINCRLAGF